MNLVKKISRLFIAIVSIFVLFACSESIEEQAATVLQSAREAYEIGDFQGAKMLLDSLKVKYPKAFEARREALKLTREVELAEQQRSVEYFDSMLVAKRGELENVLKVGGFTFEKDEKYQEVGNFMIASQAPMKNIGNSYLRGQVDEKGVLTLTSIYRGRPISHNRVKVSAEGSSAESTNPFNIYTSKHLGVTTERVDFRFGKDEGIIGFIVLNNSKTIKVELSGKSTYSYTMRKDDVKAISSLYNLSMLLRSIDELEASRDEAMRHIEFVKRNKRRSESTDSIAK
ncbi:MAG: hypothetical protein IJY75_01435 [Bacteroidaceae bacterium]|nr:hypothetical protein [Bacteroidaceae bacterium]